MLNALKFIGKVFLVACLSAAIIASVSFFRTTGILRGRTELHVSDQKCINLTTASILPGSLKNSDGSRRIIKQVSVYLDNSAGSFGASNLQYGITTSTSATATSSFYGIISPTSFVSSTAPQYITSSTFSVVLNRVWNTNEYLNIGFSRIASTTGKFCVEYFY